MNLTPSDAQTAIRTHLDNVFEVANVSWEVQEHPDDLYKKRLNGVSEAERVEDDHHMKTRRSLFQIHSLSANLVVHII